MKEKELTKKDLNNLKKAQEKIENHKKLPKEILAKINRRIFQNLIVAIGLVVYFYFINLASIHIPNGKVMIDLKVFSLIAIFVTIFIFEYSYKKDSGILCIFGIESLIVSIATLFLAYFYTIDGVLFQKIVTWISFLFSIYYMIKSVLIYGKMKREYYKSISDISDIVKKENKKEKNS